MTHDAHEQPVPVRPQTERLIRGARAARSLSETLWEALDDAVAESQAARVAELSARLAEISLTVASLAKPGRRPAPEMRRTEAESHGEEAQGEEAGAECHGEEPHGEERTRARARAHAPASESIVPELVESELVGSEPVKSEPTESEPAAYECAVLVDELASHDQLETLGASRSEPQAQSNIAIRDERMPAVHPRGVPSIEPGDIERAHTEPARADDGSGPAPWAASLERRLERYQQDGLAFALLLLELADVQRLRHAELPGEVARLTTLVETELSAQLRPADSLMRETPGRYWLLAPQTDGASAQALATQMTAAVGRTASHRGAPLRLAVGIAVCPRDALDAAELVDRAEVGLYEAHASGRPLAPAADRSVFDQDDVD